MGKQSVPESYDLAVKNVLPTLSVTQRDLLSAKSHQEKVKPLL